MKILLVNKFLYPRGGAENYMFRLGEILAGHGHAVQYFGMDDRRNIVGNDAGSYVSPMDLQSGMRRNWTAPFRIIYSGEARRKIRRVLDRFGPDVVHFNNIQFYLTPSVILETEKYSRQTGRAVRMIYTAHDYQLICPSHGLFDNRVRICEKCLGGSYLPCIRTRCVKGSALKSLLGAADAYVWKRSAAYSHIDRIICPSGFLKRKLDTQARFRAKTCVLQNFVHETGCQTVEKGDYVINFGKLCRDKGTGTLLRACRELPGIPFVFAGYGPMENEIAGVPNARFVGFKTGGELETLIRKARFSVYPSEWYENCPFSVIESQMYRTPVIASRMGGIPELVREGKTGDLFAAGDARELKTKIESLWNDRERLRAYTENCGHLSFETPQTYYEKLMKIYKGVGEYENH